MAKATKEQRDMIRTLTRRANRRMERASKGQRKYLETQVRKMTGATSFSSASKGLTMVQAEAKIRKLQRFLESETSTRKGWNRIIKESVRKANATLKRQGYNLTDEELADLLEQFDAESNIDYYWAINLVEAAKEKDPDWKGTIDQIANALESKASYQDALEAAQQAQRDRAAREAKSKKVQQYRQKAAAKKERIGRKKR